MSGRSVDRGTVLLAVAAGILAAGCSVVTPPPMRMIHEPVLRTDPGGVSVTAVGGGGGGVFLDESAGGEARIGFQATRELDFEFSGGAGTRVGDDNDDKTGVPDVLGWGRVGGRYRPDALDWVALRFGVGGGAADTGLTYFTSDVGVSFGYSFLRRVRPYVGLSLAMSVPVDPGPWIEDEDGDEIRRRPGTTLWMGGGLGLSVRVVENLEVGFEGFADLGWDPGGDTATAFGGTAMIRYTFGPVRKEWPKGRLGDPAGWKPRETPSSAAPEVPGPEVAAPPPSDPAAEPAPETAPQPAGENVPEDAPKPAPEPAPAAGPIE